MPRDAWAHPPPYKIFLSMSYIGNDWQAESANMLKAMAASPALKGKVDLHIQVSGPSPEKQSQQINGMVQAGADAIIMYSSSDTLLNRAVRQACQSGVLVFTYDSPITEPCAYQLTIDQSEWGHATAEWLAKAMGYKGNVVMITGVPGTSVATRREAEAKKVFANYPNIKIIAEAPGMWTQAIARSTLAKIIATHHWDALQGFWMDTGCYTVGSMEEEAGIPDSQKRPCAGEGTNGHRLQMLASGTPVQGASGNYRPMGYPSMSAASPTFEGALALKLAVGLLDGTVKMPHMNVVPLPAYTNATVRLCVTGTWKEMQSTGCNVFAPTVIPNPGWLSTIYSPRTPEVGLAAALHGTPE